MKRVYEGSDKSCRYRQRFFRCGLSMLKSVVCNLFLNKWYITNGGEESSRKFSKKALLVSRRPSQLGYHFSDQFGCFETAWSPKLIILSFGMALATAADLLYNFPAAYLNRFLNPNWVSWDSSLLIGSWHARGFAVKHCILTGLCTLNPIDFCLTCLPI